MADATLIVIRHGDVLVFVLQLGPDLITARTQLTESERLAIARSLAPFRRNHQGNAPHEAGEIVEIGKRLFREIVPHAIREVIGETQSSLVFETDDRSLPWELFHDGTDFFACAGPSGYRRWSHGCDAHALPAASPESSR